MLYELEIKNSSLIAIKKVIKHELWSNSHHFDSPEDLSKYITDYLELSTPIDEIENLMRSAPMDVWMKFE